jgi:multiple sugar transport system permease protein
MTPQPVTRVVLLVALLPAAVFALFPFLWMVATSFKPMFEIYRPGIHLLADEPTLANYRTVLFDSDIVRYLLNGVIVTVSILVLQLLVVVPAAFAFARMRLPARETLFTFVIMGLVFPRYIAAVPNFLLLARVGMINSYAGLVVPFVGSAFGIFLLRQFMRQVPQDYIDAARIDGVRLPGLLCLVIVPLVRPALGAFAVFSVVAHWNDLFWPMVVVNTSRLFTPPAGVVYFADVEMGTNEGAVMAAGTLIIAPLVGLFLAARRYFIESLAHVGLK